MAAKRAKHLAPNNATICGVEMLRLLAGALLLSDFSALWGGAAATQSKPPSVESKKIEALKQCNFGFKCWRVSFHLRIQKLRTVYESGRLSKLCTVEPRYVIQSPNGPQQIWPYQND